MAKMSLKNIIYLISNVFGTEFYAYGRSIAKNKLELVKNNLISTEELVISTEY